jgi:hypothetical protein
MRKPERAFGPHAGWLPPEAATPLAAEAIRDLEIHEEEEVFSRLFDFILTLSDA